MSIDVKVFNENVNKFLIVLPKRLQKINKSLALTTIPVIKKRLIDKGITGEGKSTGQYSDRPISPGLLIGKGLGVGSDKKVEAYLKAQKKANPEAPALISYKKFRELNNRPTDHVTLSFTGETLNDVGVISELIIGGSIVTSVGSKNSKTKKVTDKKGKETGTIGTGDVLDQLGEKYGDILSLTPQEEREIEEAFDDEIQNLINEFL